ncbi:MAG: hypothetical protein IJX53_06100 [Clostridia bacterium]|nr:hypothetical protein [Clostridia bacterium]
MKHTMHKTIAALLLAALCLPALAACSDDAGTPAADTTAAGQVTTAAPETEAPSLFEQLPKNNYGGAQFNILIPSQHSYEFAAEVTGEVVNDTVFERDATIESTYGVDLNYIAESGDWGARQNYTGLIRNSIMAQDGAYDLVDGMISIVMPMTMEGLFQNLVNVDGINFDDPWWSADIYDNLQVAGKLYSLTGSSMLSMYKTTYVMYANTKLISDYGLADPVDLVIEGKWTLDAFLGMVTGYSRDLDGNSTMDDQDFYGYAFENVPQRGFQTALQLDMVKREADGKLTFIGASERYLAAIDKVAVLFDNKSDWFTNTKSAVTTPVFTNDRAIILGGTIETVEGLRDMSSDFVMLPQPKYDEAQENYRVQMGTASGMFFIPTTANNTEMTVDVLNAHGALSYMDVVPAYYEDALKYRYTRIEKNMEVIDIINRSIMLDITYAHSQTIGNRITEMFVRNTTDGLQVASYFRTIDKAVQKSLDTIYETFAGLQT